MTSMLSRLAGPIALALLAMIVSPAIGQEAQQPTHFPIKAPEQLRWSFAGPFGRFDPAQLQRGFLIYREVCSNCHSMKLVAFRNLAQPGGLELTAEQVKAIAASYPVKVNDGPNDAGEMFERSPRASDRIPSRFANEQAAAAANNGAVPPDLSLMAKARAAERGPIWTVIDFFTQYQEAGPDYVHSLLTGFQDPPPGVKVPDGTYYNPYFLNAPSLAMPPPLSAGQVAYTDGTPTTVDQYARDVAAFLMWTAEPHLIERKRMGFEVFVFLLIFAGLMYLTKKRVWAGVAH
jgi:ubiquinol-cytochrome c reductase cytochrome c1 subunit